MCLIAFYVSIKDLLSCWTIVNSASLMIQNANHKHGPRNVMCGMHENVDGCLFDGLSPRRPWGKTYAFISWLLVLDECFASTSVNLVMQGVHQREKESYGAKLVWS